MRWRRPRVVLIGDSAAAATFHVGDEARFEADLALVGRLLPRARCTAVRSAALAAAAEANLLVITGGGNLSSASRTLIAERLALARATVGGGGAVAMLGQSVGPALTPRDAEQVAELLDLACFVGLRDDASMRIALGMGIDRSTVCEQLDDAWVMAGSPSAELRVVPERPVIAVTLHPDPRVVPFRAIGALADQLNQIVNRLGGSVVVVPYCRAQEGVLGRSDEDIAAGLAEQLDTRSVPVVSLPVLTPSEVVGVNQVADLVISSRYHPLVFAQRAGVPVLGLWGDPDVRADQVGALAPAALEGWTLPLDEAIAGGLVAAVIELCERRKEIGSWLTMMQPSLEATMAARDAQLAARLRDAGFRVTRPGEAVAGEAPDPAAAPQPAGGWNATSTTPVSRPMPDPVLAEFLDMRGYVQSLEVERDAIRSRESQDDGERPRASSTRPTTVLDQVRLEIDVNRLALVGRISGPQLDRTHVRLRVYAPELSARIDASATPLLPIVTLMASRLGTDLVIEAPVDEVAFENAQRATAMFHDWWDWRRPRMTVATTTRSLPPAPAAGLWFSRGVDSTFSLLSALAGEIRVDDNPLRLTHLFGLDWIDPPFALMSTADVWSDTEAAAASVELPLVRFTTDVRRVLDPIVSWEEAHGAVFAGLALLVGPVVGTVLISGSANPTPFGSHPALDPLWSASATRIRHFGDTYQRSEKVARLAQDRWAMRRLRVCWKADSQRNCGRCEKCLVTMTMLHAAGALARAERFDGRLSPEAVRSLMRGSERLTTVPARVDDIVSLLPDEDADLRSAWEEIRARMRREHAEVAR